MRRVSDWTLERLHRGELGPEDGPTARAVREQLEAEPGGTQRLERLRSDDAEVLVQHPPEQVAREIRRRLSVLDTAAPRRRMTLWLALPTFTAGLAVAALLLIPRGNDPANDTLSPVGEQIGIKGLEPQVRVYRREAQGVRRLGNDAHVQAHDVLQVAYVAAGQAYGAIVSVDSRGTVSWHVPEQPGRAVALERNKEQGAPHSYELDATPGNERFFFLSSETVFAADAVVADVLAGRPLPSGIRLSSVTLQKDPS